MLKTAAERGPLKGSIADTLPAGWVNGYRSLQEAGVTRPEQRWLAQLSARQCSTMLQAVDMLVPPPGLTRVEFVPAGPGAAV
jgi:hypothetical protein